MVLDEKTSDRRSADGAAVVLTGADTGAAVDGADDNEGTGFVAAVEAGTGTYI